MTDSSKQSIERDGVRVDSITITAASPALIEEVCRKITAEVMAKIPADALSNIADRLIKDGECIRTVRDQWGGQRQETWTLSKVVQDVLIVRLKAETEKVFDRLWANPEVRVALIEHAKDIFYKGMQKLPVVAAELFVARMAQFHVDPQAEAIGSALRTLGEESTKLREAIKAASVPLQG